jgi:hypothetical protein
MKPYIVTHWLASLNKSWDFILNIIFLNIKLKKIFIIVILLNNNVHYCHIYTCTKQSKNLSSNYISMLTLLKKRTYEVHLHCTDEVNIVKKKLPIDVPHFFC